jgi:AcrR family transcriptional regulator
MARPRNADGQRTRQAILDAALDLFAEKGYFGTSLRDVAGAVGVRESALYNYFAGKEALFDAILAAHQDSKIERLAPLADGSIGEATPCYCASPTPRSTAMSNRASRSCFAS